GGAVPVEGGAYPSQRPAIAHVRQVHRDVAGPLGPAAWPAADLDIGGRNSRGRRHHLHGQPGQQAVVADLGRRPHRRLAEGFGKVDHRIVLITMTASPPLDTGYAPAPGMRTIFL